MEQFFSDPRILKRLRQGLFGPYLNSFAKQLEVDGYSLASSCDRIRMVSDFGRWLKRKSVAIEAIGSEHIRNYVRYRSKKRWTRSLGITTALRRMLKILHDEGVITKEATPLVQPPTDQLADQFVVYLTRERALAPATIATYRSIVVRFLADSCVVAPIDLSSLCSADVFSFVQRQAAIGPKRARIMTTAPTLFFELFAISGLH